MQRSATTLVDSRADPPRRRVPHVQVGGGPPIVQPGAPGQPTRTISAQKAADLTQVQFSAADVQFMQGMIGHHAQALEMAALLPERTRRDDMRLLAKRIEVSQADEIQMMQRWLEARGQQVPGRMRTTRPARRSCRGC